MGKFMVILLLGSAALMGGGMYYLQVYAYYEPITLSNGPPSPGTTQIRLTTQTSGQPEPIRVSGFKGIDANSSPLRFRGCFTISQNLDELRAAYVAYPDATPLVAPGWFDCFDATQIGGDIETGTATAFLSEQNTPYGIDRVIAVYPDGRAYAWHQINACGAVVYDGKPAPDGCPPPPGGTN